MKIQCDVCNKAEAAVFCTADEAALCPACDYRVHHANKLASKHHRFSLLLPSSKQFPVCDICQEKRAFLFCQQDRAILCKECDLPIHSSNEHTQKHNRYLLTGLKLSPTAQIYSDSLADDKTKSSTPPLSKGSLDNNNNNDSIGVPSSISEYLIETLPGWHVEDLLLDNNNTNNNFSKSVEEAFLDCEIENGSNNNNMNMGIWVPQAPSPPMQFGNNNFKDTMTNMKVHSNYNSTAASRWSDDSSFTVPQINLPSVGSKRSRGFW